MKHVLSVLVLLVSFASPAAAHLMIAQRGTLNLVGDGVFMVLSLPVSAFTDVDDDGDGKLSNAEFTKHRLNIVSAVNEHVRLMDADGSRPLEGMMLSPVAPHDNPAAPTEQLVVMGRFVLEKPDTTLRFHIGLFGQKVDEQSISVTASDKARALTHKMVLTPQQDNKELFATD